MLVRAVPRRARHELRAPSEIAALSGARRARRAGPAIDAERARQDGGRVGGTPADARGSNFRGPYLLTRQEGGAAVAPPAAGARRAKKPPEA
jgi:hypothetical protein